jgi:hypothetical protein
MMSYSLDTDTITKKKHPGNQRDLDRFRREIRRNALFIMCPVVFYGNVEHFLDIGARVEDWNQ